ncbi:MAG: hypothetical protein WD025_02790 [Bacteriovoracaceae bacterium]
MINKRAYWTLSLINFALLLFLTTTAYLWEDLAFFLGILLNQYFLIAGTAALVKGKKKSFFLVLKFFVLIAVFAYAARAMPENLIICVSIYTFQLIILAISIKRDNKKIKDIKI